MIVKKFCHGASKTYKTGNEQNFGKYARREVAFVGAPCKTNRKNCRSGYRESLKRPDFLLGYMDADHANAKTHGSQPFRITNLS